MQALHLLALLVAVLVTGTKAFTVRDLDISLFTLVTENNLAVSSKAAPSASSASASQFKCDQCHAYDNLLANCLRSLKVPSGATVNSVQLPLLQCSCRNSTFYQALGDCQTGCDGVAIQTQTQVAARCSQILAGQYSVAPNPTLNIPVATYLSFLSLYTDAAAA
ncbi:hypothetical protein BZG36_05490, partial [Bifiguratus adelaidae]